MRLEVLLAQFATNQIDRLLEIRVELGWRREGIHYCANPLMFDRPSLHAGAGPRPFSLVANRTCSLTLGSQLFPEPRITGGQITLQAFRALCFEASAYAVVSL